MSRPRLRFKVVSDVLGGQEFVFTPDEPITVGRTDENTLVLDHKSVSRRHARLESDGGYFVLTDLGSHNGTRVGEQLVTRHHLQPGDVVWFGQVGLEFSLEREEEQAGVPAVVPSEGAELGRPLTLREVFEPSDGTQTMAARKRRVPGSVLYGATLVVVVVLGLIGLVRVGQRPSGPPTFSVKVRVGEVVPLDLSWIPMAREPGWEPGLERVSGIGQPTHGRVADARRTKFRTFVAVRGKALGTTDVPVFGPPLGRVVLQVLVRGTMPEPEEKVWMSKPVSERRRYGHRMLARARLFMRRSGVVDQNTWRVVHDLTLASRLLQAIPGEQRVAAEAARDARMLRKALGARFDELARKLDILHTQGKLQECIAVARELVELFQDPVTEEHLIVNAYYKGLLAERARQEQQALGEL